MAKLEDLKRLLESARASATRRADQATPLEATAPARSASAAKNPRVLSPRRTIAATKHAQGDVDLAQAFADVRRLPPSTRARIERARPAPLATQRLADERDVLLQSKYGDEPAPQRWEIGQELEAGQTFVRPGLGTDVLGKLRRGHWSLQAELDLHGRTVDEARDVLADFSTTRASVAIVAYGSSMARDSPRRIASRCSRARCAHGSPTGTTSWPTAKRRVTQAARGRC